MVDEKYVGNPDDIALQDLTEYINSLRAERDMTSVRKTAAKLGLKKNMVDELIKGMRDPRRYEAQKLFALCTTQQEKDQLAKLLMQVHLGTHSDAILQGSSIKPLRNNPLVSMFVEAVRPQFSDWSNADVTSLIFAQHVGALVSILQCMSLFAANPSLQPPTYNDARLFNTLQDIIESRGNVDWSYAPEFCIWSLGYFLNKGQNNISRGIAFCIYNWLKSKLEESPTEYSQIDLINSTINFQIKELRNRIRGQDIVTDLDNLNRILDDPNRALFRITDLPIWLSLEFNNGLSSIDDLTKIYHQLFTSEEDYILCSVVSLTRIKSSIHHQQGTYRRELTYVVEWTTLAKSLMWLSKLWNAMLADLGLLELARSEAE